MILHARRPRFIPAKPGADASSRELFLDTIRAIAIVRVVLWHTFGAAILTYFFSAVPAMFFVTGSLIAKSLSNRAARTVIIDRLKRLLIPLWAFTAFAFAAMLGAAIIIGTPDTNVPWHRIAFWLFPLSDPKGSTWEGGYLSAPLWYLRTLLWLMLFSPLLLRAVRKSAALSFGTAIALVFALDFASRNSGFMHLFRSAPHLPWVVGDLALYSAFFMLGFVHRARGLARFTSRHWLIAAGVSGAAAAAWCLTQPVPEGVINDSHPAHLFVGFAWLAVAFAAAPAVIAFAQLRVVAPLIGWITQRTLTIYLWHSTAVVAAWALIRPLALPGIVTATAVLGVVALVTLAFVLAAGWIEDRAGGRRPRIWPRATRAEATVSSIRSRMEWRRAQTTRTPLLVRVGVAAGVVCLVASAVGLHSTAARASRAPRVPSKAPAPLQIANTTPAPNPQTNAADAHPPASSTNTNADVLRERRTPTNALAPEVAPEKSSGLQAALDEFVRSTPVKGAQVTVMKPGEWSWVAASGTAANGNSLGRNDTFMIDSTTKTFTAALVLRAADQGRLQLDALLPTLTALPDFTYAKQMTARQLLEHRTGLMSYRDTKEYRTHTERIKSAKDALMGVQAEPLDFAPGTSQAYSSTNYLVLGFLLEQLYGRSFDDLVATELLAPLDLSATHTNPPVPGEPRFSTGGMTSTSGDLALWATALLRNHEVISETALAAMMRVDTATGIGAGINGFCPCAADAAGAPKPGAYGFNAVTTFFQYSPDRDVVVVVNTTVPFVDNEAIYTGLNGLFVSLFSNAATIH